MNYCKAVNAITVYRADRTIQQKTGIITGISNTRGRKNKKAGVTSNAGCFFGLATESPGLTSVLSHIYA